MRQIISIVLIVLLGASIGMAHMIKDDLHEGGPGYLDNRMEGYEYLGWGMHGLGAGYGFGPGMMGYGGCGMMGGHYMMHGNMGPGMMCYGMGPGMWGYDANRYDGFLNGTVDLRRKLNNMQFDYNEALRNRDIKSDELIKMEKEMIELQMKIKEKWWNRTDDKEDH